MKNILDLFSESTESRKVYARLTHDVKKETSVRLGVRAIFYSLLVVLFAGITGLGFRLFSSVEDTEVGLIFITILGGIACVSGGFVGAFTNLIGASTASRYQYRLNSKPIGWISRTLLYVNTLAAIIVGLFIAGVIY